MNVCVFDYKNRIWLDGEGFLKPNGCKYCGQDERYHGWYSFCGSFEGSNGYYAIPDDALILSRMKTNRELRNKKL